MARAIIALAVIAQLAACASVIPDGKQLTRNIVAITVQMNTDGEPMTIRNGTGVMMNPTTIMTAAHLLGGDIDTVSVMHDGKHYEATLVGTDLISDVGVLSLNVPFQSSGLRPTRANVGAPAFVVGNGGGDGIHVLSGSLIFAGWSADNNSIPIIKSDALAWAGFSGGALTDTGGRFVGLVTGINETDGKYTLATPANVAISVADEIVDKGYATWPSTGLSVIETSTVNAYAELDMMEGLVIVTEDVADAFLGDEGTNLIEELDNVEIITHVNGVEAIDIGTARQAAIPSGDNEIALTIKGANGTYEWFLSLKERSSAPVFDQCACVDEAR